MAGDWRWPAGQLTGVRRPVTCYKNYSFVRKAKYTIELPIGDQLIGNSAVYIEATPAVS